MSQGNLIGKVGHPDGCGSSDAVAVYEGDDGKLTGYCWSCNTYVSNPIDPRTGVAETPTQQRATSMTLETTMGAVQSVEALPTAALPYRGISLETCEYFGDRVAYDTTDPTKIASEYYPYYSQDGALQSYQCKNPITKDFFFIGSVQGCQMYGQPQAMIAGGKRLFITEGQNDAKALLQAIVANRAGTQWANMMPSVVSLKHGVGSVEKSLGENMEFIDRYEEVVLCFDMDEPGQAAVDVAAKLIPPGKTYVAKYPLKDANDMLLAGKGEDLVKACLFNARKWSPSSIKTVKDALDAALKPVEVGVPWPWATLTQATHGIHPGLYGVAAGVGIGKSTFWHTLMGHVINNYDGKFGMFMLEEPIDDTLRRVSGSFVGKQFHDPGKQYSEEERLAAIEPLDGKMFLFDDEGERDWDRIRSNIRYMVLVEGCKYIIIDPLTALVAHLGTSEANEVLNSMMAELASMVKTLKFTCFYASHLNVPSNGPAHEEGGRVTLPQLTGSRAMIRWSHLILGLEGNRKSEDPKTRNMTKVRMLKHRMTGKLIDFDLYYNPDDGSFKELPAHYNPGDTGGSMKMPE